VLSEEGYRPPPPLAVDTFPYATWGPRTAIVGLLVALGLAIALGIPALVIDNPAPGEDFSTGANIAAQLAQVLAFFAVPIYIATRDGGTLRTALGRLGVRSFRWSAFGWMAAAIGAYLLLIGLYSLVVTPDQEDIAPSFGPIWVQVFLIVICAATSEELCFRGMLFGGIRTRLPSLGAAALSGLIFGALHAPTGVSAVPPLIIFGLVMALLYERTGSVVPGMILHALNNSVALLAQ
jgi:membrane protease YdiL (CAAX protease family)